jgi:hypothetical protein
MLPERRIYDAGFTSGMQKPGVSETGNQVINNPVEDGGGVLSTDETGKLSGWMGMRKADFDSDSLID